MRSLLGAHTKTTPERLKAAFMACSAGDEAYAAAVLAKAVAMGYIKLVDDTVSGADPRAR
jgi:hypothetical protein